MITDYKLLVEIFKKDVASLTQASNDTTADTPIQYQNTIQTRD